MTRDDSSGWAKQEGSKKQSLQSYYTAFFIAQSNSTFCNFNAVVFTSQSLSPILPFSNSHNTNRYPFLCHLTFTMVNDSVIDAVEEILRQEGVFDEIKKTLFLSVSNVVKKQKPIEINTKAKTFSESADGE